VSEPSPLHAGLVAVCTPKGWRGMLLRGPSGAGKSGLALQLIRGGWRLVADDRVIVWASGGRAWGRAPGALGGLIEAWGVGVVRAPALPFAEITRVLDCAPPGEALERTPAPTAVEVCGVRLPSLRLDAKSPAAAAAVATWCGAERV
jgi:serine kinase of HPr protein (carbohydrate metabolism regulator)